MPITQSRMLELLQAAQDYKQGLEDLTTIIRDQISQFQSGKSTVDQMIQFLSLHSESKVLLARPVDSGVTILLETKHFKSTARKNDQSRDWQRDRRERLKHGFPAQSWGKFRHHGTAPKSILPEPAVQDSLYRRASAPARVDDITRDPDYRLGELTADSETYQPREPDEQSKRDIDSWLKNAGTEKPG